MGVVCFCTCLLYMWFVLLIFSMAIITSCTYNVFLFFTIYLNHHSDLLSTNLWSLIWHFVQQSMMPFCLPDSCLLYLGSAVTHTVAPKPHSKLNFLLFPRECKCVMCVCVCVGCVSVCLHFPARQLYTSPVWRSGYSPTSSRRCHTSTGHGSHAQNCLNRSQTSTHLLWRQIGGVAEGWIQWSS